MTTVGMGVVGIILAVRCVVVLGMREEAVFDGSGAEALRTGNSQDGHGNARSNRTTSTSQANATSLVEHTTNASFEDNRNPNVAHLANALFEDNSKANASSTGANAADESFTDNGKPKLGTWRERFAEDQGFFSGCSKILVDIGSNRGVLVRKLFEPEKYSWAEYLKIFDDKFGPAAYRNQPSKVSGLCAFGFEADPQYASRLREIEIAYAQKGWRVKFFSPMVSRSDMADFLQHMEEDSPSGFKLMKMDVKAPVYKILKPFVTERLLCKQRLDMLTVQWHRWHASPEEEADISKVYDQLMNYKVCASGRSTSVLELYDLSYWSDGQPLPDENYTPKQKTINCFIWLWYLLKACATTPLLLRGFITILTCLPMRICLVFSAVVLCCITLGTGFLPPRRVSNSPLCREW